MSRKQPAPKGTEDTVLQEVSPHEKQETEKTRCLSTKEDVLQICKRVWGWIIYRYIENTRPSRTNTKRRCPFHHRGMECKSRKAGDTWSNRQVWLGAQNEAGQRLTEFCQEKALVIANTLCQQHKRRLYTWTSPDSQYWTRLIIFFAAKDGEALYS